MLCKNISKRTAVVTLYVSIVVLAVSIALLISFPSMYAKYLKKMITIEKGTIVSGIWQDIPLPIYERVYFFNITNEELFLKGEEPMNVAEIGPYTYKSRWVKDDPHWHPDGTVTYKEVRTYHFEPEMSNGTLDDEVVTLNGPMIIASTIAKNYPTLAKIGLSILLGIEGENVIIRKKVRELTYEGYDDFIIKYAPFIKPGIPFKEGKFCWLYGKNATDDGVYNVFTGSGDASKTNLINTWNGQGQLNFWNGDSCNMLNGTSIETGPPVTPEQTSYTFYQSIFCRSLTFNYTQDTTHYGIRAKRFRPTYDLFANGTENPNNVCFDVNEERPSGVLDVSPCQFGAPVFISFPHFYLADPSYLKPIVGLSPNGKEHDSYVDVELVTGISIDISVKFQINMEIKPIKGILQLEKVQKGIYPILWVDLNLEIDDYFASFLKSHLNNPKTIAYSVLGVLIGLSLLFILGCFIVERSHAHRDDDDRLIDARDAIARIYEDEYQRHDADDQLLGNEQVTSRNEASGLVNSSAVDYGTHRNAKRT